MANVAKTSGTSAFEAESQEASSTTPLLKSGADHVERRDTESLGRSARSDESEWEWKQNHENPRNWVGWYKWLTVALVSFIEFLTTMPNFMYAPNLADAQYDLGTTDDTLATLSLTIYILGFALGPLLFAPLSEMYGRCIVYRICLAVFLVMTVGCAISSSIGMLVVFRFLAGGFGAAPVAIGGAVVSDLFEVSERGTGMAIYQAGQIISAVAGPPFGGLIGAYASWRWIFWIVCILSVFALLCSFAVFRETHAPTIKRSIYGSSRSEPRYADTEDESSLTTELRHALSRPIRLLMQSPVIFACCLLIFVVIGMLNVFLTEIGRLFQRAYHMSSGTSSLVYLGLALGFVLASTVFAMTNDRVMNRLAKKHKGDVQPEFRLPAAMAAMPVIAVGLLWYGWTLHFKKAWIVPTIGSCVAGLGITTVQLSITTYTVDSFDKFSASALAAITMARSVGGALVPLVGPLLYGRLGLGWGNSVLALVVFVCCPVPVLLYYYGSQWRAKFSARNL